MIVRMCIALSKLVRLRSIFRCHQLLGVVYSCSLHCLYKSPLPLMYLVFTIFRQMPGRVLLAGGPDVDEEYMDEVVLRAPEEEEETEISESEEGQAHPSSMFSFPLFYFFVSL